VAANPFFDSFNAALPAMEAQFTENWIYNGNTYPAIAVDVIEGFTEQMKGGVIDTSGVKMWVRLEVFLASGVQEDQLINVRGRDFLLFSVSDAGDDAREFDCRSPQIDVWAT
jgi:hypothetical protein